MTGVTSRLNCSVVDWVVSVAFPVGRSGNTIVVSHNINGGVDNYRSIYVHLRDGATHDCALSWSVSLARYPGETDFRDFITSKGCTSAETDPNPASNPNSDLTLYDWGTNSGNSVINKALL